ncbi:MAG: hypothetical protein ACRER2_10550 [Methylococcales bacterium]
MNYSPIQPTIFSPCLSTALSVAAAARGFLFIALALAGLALSPAARAVGPPPPDGGYPNGNTAEGDDALLSLTSGFGNTAIGYQALYSNTSGGFNTANGYQALYSNTTGFRNTANGVSALVNNTTGGNNTANGLAALFILLMFRNASPIDQLLTYIQLVTNRKVSIL